MHIVLAMAAAVLGIGLGSASDGDVAVVQDNELTANVLRLDQLPPRVGDTLRAVLGNKRPGEIREVRCDEIPILYEADYMEDGRKAEAVIRTDGTRVPAGQLKGKSAVRERKIQLKDLPPAVTTALKTQLGEGPFEEVMELRYRSVIVLYRVANESAQVWFYPAGPLAREQKKAEAGAEAGETEKDDPGMP